MAKILRFPKIRRHKDARLSLETINRQATQAEAQRRWLEQNEVPVVQRWEWPEGWLSERLKYVRANYTYPANWPRCPNCGSYALDGHITCGDARCGPESRWR